MDGEIVAPVQDERVAVGAVQLRDGLAALDVPRVTGNGDDVVEDDVFGQQVEEVPAVGEAVEPLLDDPEERVQRLEVVEVVDGGHQAPCRAQACAGRRAKSAKLTGGIPVAFWTSWLGREPWPEAMVSVSMRSIWPYSAGTPAATVPSIHASRSMSLCLAGWPVTPAMMPAASLTVSAWGPVGAYWAPAWAPGLASVAAATAAMSSASTKASGPSPVGTVITPSTALSDVSLKFCMNPAGRTTEVVNSPLPMRSSSTALWATHWGGTWSKPKALR